MDAMKSLVPIFLALAAPTLAQQFAVELTNDSTVSSYVEIADDIGLEPQTFTIEAWMRPNGAGIGQSASTAGAALVNKPIQGAVGSVLTSYYLGWSSGSRRFVGIVGHAFPTTGTTVTGQSTVDIGTLAHVALTFDGSHLRLFVNGLLDAEAAASSSNVAYGPELLLFGASNFGSGFLRRFDGILDEIRLWDHARSEGTLAAERFCRLTGTEPGLLGYWSFDGGGLTDDTGHGHDGVFVGGGGGIVPAPQTFPSFCTRIDNSYCGPAVPNSTGTPSAMRVTGSDLVAENLVALTAANLPMNSFGYFLTSQSQGFVASPGGSQGNICLGGQIGRYVGPGQVQTTSNGTTFHLALDLTATPTPTGFVVVAAGETWYFQAWHRDSVGGNATSNFTDGSSVSFR